MVYVTPIMRHLKKTPVNGVNPSAVPRAPAEPFSTRIVSPPDTPAHIASLTSTHYLFPMTFFIQQLVSNIWLLIIEEKKVIEIPSRKGENK